MLLLVRIGDVGQRLLPVLARRLDGQRACTDHAIEQRLGEPDVGNTLQRDVTSGVAQDAAPDQHPVCGDDVVRGAHADPWPEGEEAQQDQGDDHDQDEHDGARRPVVRRERDADAGRAADQDEPQRRRDERDPVRMQVFDDLLVVGKDLLRVRHANLLDTVGCLR